MSRKQREKRHQASLKAREARRQEILAIPAGTLIVYSWRPWNLALGRVRCQGTRLKELQCRPLGPNGGQYRGYYSPALVVERYIDATFTDKLDIFSKRNYMKSQPGPVEDYIFPDWFRYILPEDEQVLFALSQDYDFPPL